MRLIRFLAWLFFCSFAALESREVLSHQFIDYGNGEPVPALFYVCLKKDFFHDPTVSFWNYSLSEVVDSGDILESKDNTNNSFCLSALPCTALAQLDELPEVEEGFFQNNYLVSGFEVFLSDSENYSLRKKVSLPEDKKNLEDKPVLDEKNSSLPVKASLDNQTAVEISSTHSVVKFSSYLFMIGAVLLLFNVLKNNNILSLNTVGKDKILIARRKKWLERARKSGSITEATYLELLRKITSRIWHTENKENIKDYSEFDFDSSKTVGDFNKRKSGESVVSIRDMSELKTSR